MTCSDCYTKMTCKNLIEGCRLLIDTTDNRAMAFMDWLRIMPMDKPTQEDINRKMI